MAVRDDLGFQRNKGDSMYVRLGGRRTPGISIGTIDGAQLFDAGLPETPPNTSAWKASSAWIRIPVKRIVKGSEGKYVVPGEVELCEFLNENVRAQSFHICNGKRRKQI